MSMHRFFISPDSISNDSVFITGTLIQRLRNVLRLSIGDHIIVLDNTGWEYEVELNTIREARVEGRIISRLLTENEPANNITLYQAILKGNGFELVLQKCTEIGVTGFVPIVSERCVAKEPGKSRYNRWQNVILEAAQQSRRGKLPILHSIETFTNACSSVEGFSILPWEGEKNKGLKDTLQSIDGLKRHKNIAIFIGPEGGVSAEEVSLAQRKGIMPVSMGKRIFRAETAGLITATIMLYELGEMDLRSGSKDN